MDLFNIFKGNVGHDPHVPVIKMFHVISDFICIAIYANLRRKKPLHLFNQSPENVNFYYPLIVQSQNSVKFNQVAPVFGQILCSTICLYGYLHE